MVHLCNHMNIGPGRHIDCTDRHILLRHMEMCVGLLGIKGKAVILVPLVNNAIRSLDDFPMVEGKTIVCRRGFKGDTCSKWQIGRAVFTCTAIELRSGLSTLNC